METVSSFGMLDDFQWITWHYIPEDSTPIIAAEVRKLQLH
jgi:hypothetical protein